MINARDAEPYSWPWLGVVMFNNEHACGFSLIQAKVCDKKTKFAVTAAHCFDKHIMDPAAK